MFIEAITVSVGYSDILRHTLPSIVQQVDRLVVVTSPKDSETLDLCHRHNLQVLTTSDFYRGGDEFNKGRAIERGLAMLSHRDWLLHLDSDVALPSDFRESLGVADIDAACIYGADRLMVVGWDQWQKLRSKGTTSRAWHCYQSPGEFPVGARWCDVRYGYVPIGYFQLWHQSADHRNGIRLRRYPDNHQDAARADVKFALQWDRRHRQVLPEVYVAHIESEPSPTGTNWKGRRSKRFGPPDSTTGAGRVS
jgi:hypothetical protein